MRHLRRGLGVLSVMAGSRAARLAFFSVLSLLAAWPYLATAGAFNDFRDAQVLWLYEDGARRSVLDFGQFPLWTPEHCGGLPLLGTPQSRFFSPTFLLTLLFGTTRAEPVIVFVMVLLGHLGAYQYLRERRATQLGATLAAPVFGLMGLMACAPFLGWLGFLGFALLPWALWGVRRAARGELRGALVVAAVAAWMVGFGGTYVAPVSSVACALELAGLALAARGRVSWSTVAVGAVLAVGLSAARLWPVWDELHRAPRIIAGVSGNPPGVLLGLLFGLWPPFAGETWYLVGVPAGVVAGLALTRRRVLGPLVGLAVWAWLAQGYEATPALFGWLRQLPIFSMLRNPERFLVPLTVLLALGAAWAVGDFAARARQRKQRRPALMTALQALAVVGLLINVPMQLFNFRLAARARTLTPTPLAERREFHQARGNRWAAASFGPMSRGSLACWEAYPLPQSPKLRGDLPQESWLTDPSAGAVEPRAWSPQRLDFQLRLARPATLVVNQNHHVGWKSSVGTVVSSEGLLAVELPAGEHLVTLRFLPKSAVGGLTVSGLAAVVALLAWRWRRLATLPRAVVVGLATVPLLTGLVLGAVLEEPLASRPPIQGPEGEPLVIDAAPEGSRALGVPLEGEVTLEAASLSYRPEDDRVRVEVDWRHGPSVNPHLGVFLHAEPGGLKRIGADHTQLSDALFLEEGPPGRIIRDILLLDVPPSRRSEPWNVWVGLWEMRGDGHRLAVTPTAGVRIEDNRVLVGSVVIGTPSDAGQ